MFELASADFEWAFSLAPGAILQWTMLPGLLVGLLPHGLAAGGTTIPTGEDRGIHPSAKNALGLLDKTKGSTAVPCSLRFED